MDAETVRELFAEFGPVSVRRMFGGAGIFVDGLMIGLIARGVIYLKADEHTIADFEREGQGPFTYGTKDGERTLASYWRMPDRLYDDIEELARWAGAAHETAQRNAPRRNKSPSKGSRGRRRRL
jgi:DNA transformation protein